MNRQKREMATASGLNSETNVTDFEHHGNNLRAYFRANPNSCDTSATLAFLDRFGPYRWREDFEDCAYEQLSFGSNNEGDIFSIIAEAHNPTSTHIFRFNIFSHETIELAHAEVPTQKDSADIAYEHSGGSCVKRRLDTAIGDRSVSLILSGRGNRYVVTSENHLDSNFAKDQPLNDCRMLNHQIRYDQNKRLKLAQHTILQTVLVAP